MTAIKFDKLKGEAKKSDVKYMKLADGENTFRILPESILPGYTYWVKGASGKDLPFECLQYDRGNEKFVNSQPDPVKDRKLKDAKTGDDLRCQWSYKCQVINKATGGVEILQLKKGILNGIIDVAQNMSIDPTDLEIGTWFTVNRKKTGPLPFNVEYSINTFKCKSEALDEASLAKLEGIKKIEELFKVETYAEQAARLEKHLSGVKEEVSTAANTDQEAIDELS